MNGLIRRNLGWLLAAAVFSPLAAALAAEPFAFEDVTRQTGLAEWLEGPKSSDDPEGRPWRYAHGAGWGDVDGDGRPDLYLGAFAARPWYEGDGSPVPNRLFRNTGDGFQAVSQPAIEFLERDARCAGVLFADLDNDGDLDLVVANHIQRKGHRGSRLFENDGRGQFRDVTPDTSDWPHGLGVRNVSVIDVDRDGRLDLVIADGSYGREAEAAARLIVLRNRGGFGFEDVSAELGLPQEQTQGLGLAVGDANGDGRPDVFVAGSNRLFVSGPDGGFREAHPGRFAMTPADENEGLHCGAAFGDLNGDDRLDLVTTEHGVPARIHVFLNRGVVDGIPDLVEVSESAGLGALFPTGTREQPIKTAHVALQDMDHDGRADVVLTAIQRDEQGRLQPVVLPNLSERGRALRFKPPPFDRLVGYSAPGPLGDFDRDGRLDMFLPSWFEDVPNYLFRNVTKGGRWLAVRVTGDGRRLNTMGVGAIVRVYRAGHAGEPQHLLGRRDIVVGTGYASCEEARAHFGLGEHDRCDVDVSWDGRQVVQRNVAVDRELTVTMTP